MKRYRIAYDKRYQGTIEDKNGEWVCIKNCIVCEQENMMMGDPLDEINKQIQKQIKDNGPFDMMIIMKEKKKDEQKN